MKDYNEKTIYIGIDVHKKTYALACICENKIIKREVLPAQPTILLNYVKKHFEAAKIISAYEAGFSGFHLHRLLVKHGIKNKVVHAGSIEIASRDRVKTDKRDALKLSQQLAAGRLKSISIPSETREQMRILTRLRDQWVTHRKRIGNQFKSLLFQQGLISPEEDDKVSKKWLEKYLTLKMSEELSYAVKVYAQEWLGLSKQIADLDKRLTEQSRQDELIDHVYRQIPGIGALSARILSNELEDMRHFKHVKSLYSYTGLTPSEQSSGSHRYQGHITRQGKALLRKILVQVSWQTIKKDKGLFLYFEQLSKRAGKKRAIVAVARKLIGRIRHTFMTGETYEYERLNPVAR